MPSGLANKEKQRVRQLFAEGKVEQGGTARGRSRQSYHGAGTCTFYGTANSNQMMMELMGLHIPGAAFVNPGHAAAPGADPRRGASAGRSWRRTRRGRWPRSSTRRRSSTPTVGLLATGGSTNHAIHLPAIARAAGIIIDWEDFDELSAAVPLIARIYPNGSGDVNDFHARRRHGVRHPHLARRGPAPRRHADRRRRRVRGLCRQCRSSTATSLPGEPADDSARPRHAAPGERPVPARRRHAAGQRQSRPRDLQDQRGRRRSAGRSRRRRGAFPTRTQVLAAFQAGELDRDVRRRRPLPGAARQRHARTAQADAGARRRSRTAATASRWSPTAACRAPAARCRRRSTVSPEALPDGPLGAAARRRRRPAVRRTTGRSRRSASTSRRATRRRRRRRRSAPAASCSR